MSFMRLLTQKFELPTAAEALPGRADPHRPGVRHAIFDRPLDGPRPAGCRQVLLGMGCYWGGERRFWSLPGVVLTAAGYAGGHTPNPTGAEVASGRTGHAEVVAVTYDPAVLPLAVLLLHFWEGHDPTQGMRQGDDIGTQFRSLLLLPDAEDLAVAEASRADYAAALKAAGHPRAITTTLAIHTRFYLAEDYQQQHLARVPGASCTTKGCGVPARPRSASGEAVT
ncbi:peptide-methionine (S)-S-oxide reductase MsrA [Pannonibacter tanglangensis]|uniref:Peptide methionine sulfoxide reductase MsrA n=1 Tax=Pannonibacter tanglangensis TaxID=2750084 RepID=A0ABW9ZLH6_9HYPH|nr:peptide-methionine (S)-S-oxide reductase MsrA [Pannonibacter sp. XCT-34]NBN64747.1 peptide-methionine (S)-S-oxide reductase MsrA [Pannonibacter sp. XCT-34]